MAASLRWNPDKFDWHFLFEWNFLDINRSRPFGWCLLWRRRMFIEISKIIISNKNRLKEKTNGCHKMWEEKQTLTKMHVFKCFMSQVKCELKSVNKPQIFITILCWKKRRGKNFMLSSQQWRFFFPFWREFLSIEYSCKHKGKHEPRQNQCWHSIPFNNKCNGHVIKVDFLSCFRYTFQSGLV